MSRKRQWLIPNDVLIPQCNKMIQQLGYCADNFTTYDKEQLRSLCGAQYGHVPIDDVGFQAIALRKTYKTVAVNGSGPRKASMVSDEYADYLASPKWKAYAERIKEWWEYRCAICDTDGHLEVHHRTYERLGNETTNDCIPLCKRCHKVADNRRQQEAQKGNGQMIFDV